jgi:hypothetical protein
MQLRHIRPGSLEWNDAIIESTPKIEEGLTPEEIIKLRASRESGEASRHEKKGSTERI